MLSLLFFFSIIHREQDLNFKTSLTKIKEDFLLAVELYKMYIAVLLNVYYLKSIFNYLEIF